MYLRQLEADELERGDSVRRTPARMKCVRSKECALVNPEAVAAVTVPELSVEPELAAVPVLSVEPAGPTRGALGALAQ